VLLAQRRAASAASVPPASRQRSGPSQRQALRGAASISKPATPATAIATTTKSQSASSSVVRSVRRGTMKWARPRSWSTTVRAWGPSKASASDHGATITSPQWRQRCQPCRRAGVRTGSRLPQAAQRSSAVRERPGRTPGSGAAATSIASTSAPRRRGLTRAGSTADRRSCDDASAGIPSPRGPMIACTYEDRSSARPGLELLAVSLAHRCPGVALHVFVPAPDPDLRAWARRFEQVELFEAPPRWPTGWSVKPWLLLDRLEAGFREVLWLDTDVLVTGDLPRAWGGVPAERLVVAEETASWRDGPASPPRTRGFGLEVGRVLPRPLSSSVLRVTREHRPLLLHWCELLEGRAYRRAQARPLPERPPHLEGDQDALAALLGSTEHGSLPLHVLRPPRDIVHFCWDRYASFPLRHRLITLARGMPPLLHAYGRVKPWSAEHAARRSAGLSPYDIAARPYRDALSAPASWMLPRTRDARRIDALLRGNPSLCDLPTALASAWSRRRERGLLLERGRSSGALD